MKNFTIGAEIKRILLSDPEIRSKANNKCFPIVASKGTTFPFILYSRTGFTPKSNKDYTGEIVTVQFQIIAKKYEDAVELANDVADCLISNSETAIIEDIKILNIREDYNFSDDCYVEIIDVDFELKE